VCHQVGFRPSPCSGCCYAPSPPRPPDRDTIKLRDQTASAFIGAHIGLPADHLEDHAAYIDGWLKALGDNPSSFLTAASKAQAAADWVLGEMGMD